MPGQKAGARPLTYIPTGEGWLYMAAIMDLHTRKPDVERQSEVVGWSMRDHLRAELATTARGDTGLAVGEGATAT